MLPHERYQEIIKYLKIHGIIKIDELMDMFGVSIETARRDLGYLEKEGLIKKIYGGAALIEKEATEPATSERFSRNIAEKAAIGQKCAEFIQDGDSVFLEVGTTVLQVAKAIKDKKNLTVITNSIHVANELMDTDFEIYIIGGRMRRGEGSMSGAVSIYQVENFHSGKVIVGAGGVTLENGLSDFNIEEALVRKKVIEQAKEVILAADSTKFGRDMMAHICPVSAVDLIVTNPSLPSPLLTQFENAGINIVFAER